MTNSNALRRVDAHAHIFTQAMPLIANPRHQPRYDFTLQDYLAQLDANGVQYGVIAAASPWIEAETGAVGGGEGCAHLYGLARSCGTGLCA